MDAAMYAKHQLETCLGLLCVCASGMDDDSYNWQPPGTANVAGKTHVHAVSSVDFFVNVAARGSDRIWTEFALAHDLPNNPREIWSCADPIPYAAMQEYARRVQMTALDYVASLGGNDLDREVDAQVYGRKSVAFLLNFAGTHAVMHGGDLAAVKGMLGLKGLPF